jgi:hypothetical protein
MEQSRHAEFNIRPGFLKFPASYVTQIFIVNLKGQQEALLDVLNP